MILLDDNELVCHDIVEAYSLYMGLPSTWLISVPALPERERQRILAIAREVRKGVDEEFNFCRPRGGCFDAAIELSDRLTKEDIEHEVVGGYFLAPSGSPLALGDIEDPDEELEPTSGHIWIQFPQYNDTILDVTTDQFGEDFPQIWLDADERLYEPREILKVTRIKPGHFRVGPIQRRSVYVRRHIRNKLIKHLKHPPRSCLCHRIKSVDQVRRKIVRRLK